MSRRDRRPGDAGRPVGDDGEELWQSVARSTTRLRAKPRVGAHTPVEPPRAGPASSERTPAKQAEKPGGKPPAPQRPSAKNSRPAPLADLDRRTVRQIGSGRIEIDDRLDLHGATQAQARVRLRAFLRQSQAQGFRTVLVITGKGGGPEPADNLGRALGEPQRGVLRGSVPTWLEEADMRPIVLGYAPAVRHGGQGALYVQLRKAARDERD